MTSVGWMDGPSPVAASRNEVVQMETVKTPKSTGNDFRMPPVSTSATQNSDPFMDLTQSRPTAQNTALFDGFSTLSAVPPPVSPAPQQTFFQQSSPPVMVATLYLIPGQI